MLGERKESHKQLHEDKTKHYWRYTVRCTNFYVVIELLLGIYYLMATISFCSNLANQSKNDIAKQLFVVDVFKIP